LTTSGTAPLTGVHTGRLAVEQLYGYMIRNSKTYGILTTLRGWCFAYRGNQGQLLTTRMFASHPPEPNSSHPDGYTQPSVTTLMAIYYLSHLSLDAPDTVEMLRPGQFGEIELQFADPDTSRAAPTPEPRTNPNHYAQNIAPAPYGHRGYQYAVRFEPWVQGNQLGGKSWIVDLYPAATKAVLKLWDGQDESMKHNEADTYKRLEPLWGRCVPRFIGLDIWEHSNSIVVEYIKVGPSFPLSIDV
jgi:hypothetical protein